MEPASVDSNKDSKNFYNIGPGEVELSELKTPEPKVEAPQKVPAAPAAPAEEPGFICAMFKEWIIIPIKNVIAGFTEVYIFFRDFRKPIPKSALEILLVKHQILENKYEFTRTE
jgi:hypothetical protein